MREKKLYSTAIIPDELYVHRNADRKLKEVILRMSKPAYISVARQMGKTNLLIQTKRALENDSNRYVYIDVTNKFESAQECFRYIVNQILNSNEEIKEFQEAFEYIRESRKLTTTNPTEEFQNEIREILKRFKGNIVVFLDEVDDLRKHVFSDDIFGQIRKTYFINETYPVLKRITYILSGVIDPEKLIKTKDNSPFNIAIPIYLDDFNYTEFLELISKSELIIDSEIKEYIYSWLQGNPRMSFEILSLVEDRYLSGNLITREIVDSVIKDFYLTNFKNPPIDHIRDLIKQNTEVRKALIKLKKGQTSELSDEIINKFYLFGITSTKINKEKISIKNKVIELSLSDDWLEKIELEKKGYFDLGKEKIEAKLYEEGIGYLKEYILNEPKGSLVDVANFQIGEAYYLLRQHNLSNQYLEKPFDKKFPEVYFKQLFYIGVNYFKLGDQQNAIVSFNEVISESNIPNLILPSILNMGEIELKNSEIKYEKSEGNYLKAYEYLTENILKIDEIEYYFKLIYFRLGYINRTLRDKKQIAIEYFEKALEYSKLNEQPIIMLYIDSCIDSPLEKKLIIYKNLYNRIIENELKFDDQATLEIIVPFNEMQLLLILSNLIVYKLEVEFDNLIQYSLITLYLGKLQEFELLDKVATFSVNSNNFDVGEIIYSRILELPNVTANTIKVAHQILGLIAGNREEWGISYIHLTEYIKLFALNADKSTTLEVIDFNAFIMIIDYHRKNKNYKESFDIASIIENYFIDTLNIENKANSAVILFFIMDYYSFIGNIIKTVEYAERILLLITDIKPIINELSYVDKKGLENIEKQTKSIMRGIKGIKSIDPIKIIREPGRNEYVKVKYKNGQEITAKYKKVIDDIKNGVCHLL